MISLKKIAIKESSCQCLKVMMKMDLYFVSLIFLMIIYKTLIIIIPFKCIITCYINTEKYDFQACNGSEEVLHSNLSVSEPTCHAVTFRINEGERIVGTSGHRVKGLRESAMVLKTFLL